MKNEKVPLEIKVKKKVWGKEKELGFILKTSPHNLRVCSSYKDVFWVSII